MNPCAYNYSHAGSGKSITGAHMAYTLAKKLRKERSNSFPLKQKKGVTIEELKPCVMYCGPSNQAVNVVLSKLHLSDQLEVVVKL